MYMQMIFSINSYMILKVEVVVSEFSVALPLIPVSVTVYVSNSSGTLSGIIYSSIGTYTAPSSNITEPVTGDKSSNGEGPLTTKNT